MVLEIKDKGPGISGDPERIVKNGVGLSNTAERLERLYGENHSFHLQNINDGGLQVVMEIPYRLSSQEEYSDERH